MTKILIKTIQLILLFPQERLAENPSGVRIKAKIKHSLGDKSLSLFLSRLFSLQFRKNFIRLIIPRRSISPIETKFNIFSETKDEKKNEKTTPEPMTIKFISVIEIIEMKGIFIFEIP